MPTMGRLSTRRWTIRDQVAKRVHVVEQDPARDTLKTSCEHDGPQPTPQADEERGQDTSAPRCLAVDGPTFSASRYPPENDGGRISHSAHAESQAYGLREVRNVR